MAVKKKNYCVRISEILQPDQEQFVMERLAAHIKKDAKEWEDYFRGTDTVEIKRLSEEEAASLAATLEGNELEVSVYRLSEKAAENESVKLKCPRCGYAMEYPDWRCPECFYEFPEYDFDDV
jgi:rubrerythrin